MFGERIRALVCEVKTHVYIGGSIGLVANEIVFHLAKGKVEIFRDKEAFELFNEFTTGGWQFFSNTAFKKDEIIRDGWNNIFSSCEHSLM